MPEIKIYTTDYCPYCKKAKKFFDDKNLTYEEIDITNDESSMRAQLLEQTGIRTVPQIFINGKFIGGFDTLIKLNSAGELDEIL